MCIHVVVEKITKLEPYNLSNFVSFSESSKLYKVHVLSQLKIVVSQDVKFIEKARSSMSREPPGEIEKGEKILVPEVIYVCPINLNWHMLMETNYS